MCFAGKGQCRSGTGLDIRLTSHLSSKARARCSFEIKVDKIRLQPDPD